MCSVCADFEQRRAAGSITLSFGAIAQVVERFHGMEEAGGSSPPSSTDTLVDAFILCIRRTGMTLGGLVAGEGCFTKSLVRPPRVSGAERLRFVFKVSMARRDRPLLESLRAFLGVGSIQDVPARSARWQPESTYSVTSRRQLRMRVIPFAETFLLPGAKRNQFDRWRRLFDDYEREYPSKWGTGRSICSEPGCFRPVRGRGLCRRHYYRATGY
jgi:hypothetical protein